MASTTTAQPRDQKDQKSMIGQAATAVHDAADSATTAVGGGMESLAGTVRNNLPHEGMVGAAADAVAGTLESGGRYLKDRSPNEMLDDVTEMIRKNPITCVLAGLGVGFLVARLMKR